MEAGSQLKSVLNLQLASDSSSVFHLPYVLSTLSKDSLSPSPHLAKWSARIISLLHSKDPGARWAGLCIAHKSALLSKSFMVESAASWLPIVIPMLSRAEPSPILKAAIRLLITVFTAAMEMSEFQRQVSLPHVPKFTSALSNIAASNEDIELKAICLNSLSCLIPNYPTAHRATFANLSGLALGFLNGSHPRSTPAPLLKSAAQLYSILHLTGGKVGAANLWRKALDDTLAFGWDAFFAVRTTFPSDAKSPAPRQEQNDSSISVPLNVDRIRCCSTIIRDLLCTLTTRPVQVPSGLLIKYAIALVGASPDGQVEGFVDPATRAMEISIVPSLWKYGCEIIATLAENIPHCLEPALAQLYTALAHRLEQSLTQEQRASVLDTLQQLLQASRFIDSPILPNRIMRAVLPSLTIVLSSSNVVDASPEDNKSNKGKKKTKNYTGDEVFKVSRDVICPTEADAKVLLSALQVVKYCLQNPNLSSTQSSLASRILLSIQLSLSQLSPSVLSPDPQVFCQVQQTVHVICTGMASTSTVSLQKALPLILKESLKTGDTELQSAFDLLIHPRLPPIVRPIPLIQSLTLFRVEESEEEVAARKQLRLEFGNESLSVPNSREQDTVMEDVVPPVPVPQVQQNGGEAIRLPFLSNQPAVPQPPQTQPPVQSAAPKFWRNEEQYHQQIITPAVTQAAVPSSEKQKLNSNPPGQNAVASSSSSFLIPQSNSDAEDQDEEMPTIDMASDSEDEENDE